MGDTANVRAWQTGKVYTAPVGTTGPTDVTTALAAGWLDLGILEQDAGLEETREETRTEVYGWGVGLVRTVFSKHKRTLKVVALETNAVVMDLINPGSTATTATGTTTYVVKAPVHEPQAFVIEETDGSIKRRRVIKTGQVSSSAAVKDAENGVTQYELTIDIYPDASTSEIWTEISNDPAMADLAS